MCVCVCAPLYLPPKGNSASDRRRRRRYGDGDGYRYRYIWSVNSSFSVYWCKNQNKNKTTQQTKKNTLQWKVYSYPAARSFIACLYFAYFNRTIAIICTFWFFFVERASVFSRTLSLNFYFLMYCIGWRVCLKRFNTYAFIWS